MIDDVSQDRTPWGWLRGFAWFLLAWPVLSLLALDHMDFSDWETILTAMLGPPTLGLALLGLERALTRMFGRAARGLAQAVPSTLRDISNLALALAVLMGIDVALVSMFEDESLFARADLDAGPISAWILAGCFGAALVFRGLHRLAYGPARRVDLGVAWDDAPGLIRLLGYLTLIPSLLVCTVMIDYALHSKAGFGLASWIAIPALVLLGQRSAMAGSPRYWARNPWEVWMRRMSLELPWWVVAYAAGLATSAMFLLLPTGLGDDELSTAGRIIAVIFAVPLGLLVLAMTGVAFYQSVPITLRRWRTAWVLARRPEQLVDWIVHEASEPYLLLRLRDGREVPFATGDEVGPLLDWLRRNGPPHG